MPTVTFKTDSTAEPLLIVTQDGVNHRLALTPAGGKERTATLSLPINTPALLTWIFAGNPGAKYEIKLSPKAKIKLSRGSNPIASSIPTQRLFGQGSVMFKVTS